MSIKQTFDVFGKFVVQQSRSRLTKAKKNQSKALYNSLGYEVTAGPNSFSLAFTMADYGKFVDKGVKGVSSSSKAPNSPYKFGTGSGRSGGLTQGVDKWVRAKRIQFRDRNSGKFMSYENTAFLIRRAIWHKGIETTNFFTTPFEQAFKKLPDDVVNAFALEVDNLFNFANK